jgi:hypothetical protein
MREVAFVPKSIELNGSFRLPVPPSTAFELFSPLGEKRWVPDWRPELLYPAGVAWQRGLIFRTAEERGEAVWVVTKLDHEGHEVEYHRVEAGRYVAKVTVRCRGEGASHTEVSVGYVFVGLSDVGNQDIAAMSREPYRQKMERWQRWIEACLSRETQ